MTSDYILTTLTRSFEAGQAVVVRMVNGNVSVEPLTAELSDELNREAAAEFYDEHYPPPGGFL